MEIYIGVDWDRKKSVCVFRVPEAKKPLVRKVRPTPESVQSLVDEVRRRNPEASLVRVGVEAGNERWPRLFHEAGTVVHVLDGKQAKNYGKSLRSSGAKNDTLDATVLESMVRSQEHRREPWSPPSPLHAQLDRLSRAHESTSKVAVQLTNRIRARLAETLPELNECIKTLVSPWARRLLRRVSTPAQAENFDLDELDAVVGPQLGATRRAAVRAALGRSWNYMSEAEAAGEALLMQVYLDQLDTALQGLKQIEKALQRAARQDEACERLRSVKGIGLQLGVGLVVLCFGQIDAHGERDAASVRLGASPVSRHTGQQRNVSVNMRRSAPARGRRLSYLLGLQASNHLPWAKAMYAYARGRGKSAATAYRQIARSVLRILTAMIRDGVDYDEARYVAALKAKGVPWAQSLGEAPASELAAA